MTALRLMDDARDTLKIELWQRFQVFSKQYGDGVMSSCHPGHDARFAAKVAGRPCARLQVSAVSKFDRINRLQILRDERRLPARLSSQPISTSQYAVGDGSDFAESIAVKICNV